MDVAKLLNQPVRELSLGERMKMELIAALLHSPEVLFLDEPTIGLDVIAQHNIQKFLKHYQEVRQITILLTSHYMKDVAALCRRVVVINHGHIVYDGSLAGIIDRFSSHKVLTLLFDDGQMPNDLSALRRSDRANRPPRQAPRRPQPDLRRSSPPSSPTTRSKTSVSKTRRWKKSSPRCSPNQRTER